MESRSRSVLLVDDNSDDVALAQRALKRSGLSATMEVAYSGNEGWERLIEKSPRALFLDLNMPGVSGFDLLQRVRADARTRDVPVIILTTSKEPSDIHRCYSLGANSFVTKPVDFTEFIEVFGQMMRYWTDLNQV